MTRLTLRAPAVAGVLVLTIVAGCSSSDKASTASGGSTTSVTGAAATTATSAATATTAAAATGAATTAKVVNAANAFLATLSSAEKGTVQFDWTNTAQKQRWSNFPQGIFNRTGLMWGNLSATTQNAWMAIMQASLSTDGYNRVMSEWNADEALAAQQGGGGMMFGKKYYFIALIGVPSESGPWMWQFGGHHVTVNATVAGGHISVTPSFIGAQPSSYTDAGKTVRPLGDIADEAFALLNSLDAAGKSAAVRGSTAIDVVLGPGQDGKTVAAEGLQVSKMTADQQVAVWKLVGHYVGLVNDAEAAARMTEVKSTPDQTYFAWYGPTTAGSAAYFRVSGPTVVVEYAPQGGGGPGGGGSGASVDHIHGIYRDPTNDYGAKYAK